MKGTISVLGLYNWDNTLFDLLYIPEGLDRETLVDFILAECSDLEVLYPNPTVLKNLIGVWSVTQKYSWDKLYATMQLQYNPIDNYDRTETRTLDSKATGSSKDSGTDTVTNINSGTDSGTNDTTNLNQVKAFDTAANTFTDREKETINNTVSTTYGKKTTDSTQYGHKNDNTYDKNDTENIRAHGNIGTVTTQAMIEAERNIAAFNVYQVMLDEFKQRFCLLVY